MNLSRGIAVKRAGAEIQELADPDREAAVYKSALNPADNFEILFEIPVLFYVAALTLCATGLTDSIYVAAAWVFVVTRVLHTLVHCTSNNVTLRAVTYGIGTMIVFATWVRIALQIL